MFKLLCIGVLWCLITPEDFIYYCLVEVLLIFFVRETDISLCLFIQYWTNLRNNYHLAFLRLDNNVLRVLLN